MTGWWWAAGGAVVLFVAVTALAVGFLIALRANRYDVSPGDSTFVAESAFEAAPAAQVVVDAAGSVLLANQTARAFGLVTAEGDIDPRIGERMADAAGRTASDGIDEWEAPGLRGRTEVLSLTAQPLGDGLVLATAIDETASRTAELIRRDFVANVSHELKSPVTALGLLAEAVAEAAGSPDTVTAFAEQMQRESARLGTLITEIIALSAIQGGGLHEVAEVRVDDVIADAIDRATVTATAAEITLRHDSASGARVLGDRGLLTTAIGNLVDNAVHYSEAGSVVTISQVVRRGIVDIAVADRGIGIAPRDQRRVFERFFRADPARSRSTGGTGLGLAIVKHVAANHRGSIRVASRIGVGSTFTLRLPLAGQAEAPEVIGPAADDNADLDPELVGPAADDTEHPAAHPTTGPPISQERT